MACPDGQIPVGINPVTMNVICMDQVLVASGAAASGNPQTGATNSWWSQAIDTLPNLLGGVADIIGATNGQKPPDNITIIQSPENTNNKNAFPWGWVIGIILLTAVIILFYFKRKNKK